MLFCFWSSEFSCFGVCYIFFDVIPNNNAFKNWFFCFLVSGKIFFFLLTSYPIPFEVHLLMLRFLLQTFKKCSTYCFSSMTILLSTLSCLCGWDSSGQNSVLCCSTAECISGNGVTHAHIVDVRKVQSEFWTERDISRKMVRHGNYSSTCLPVPSGVVQKQPQSIPGEKEITAVIKYLKIHRWCKFW